MLSRYMFLSLWPPEDHTDLWKEERSDMSCSLWSHSCAGVQVKISISEIWNVKQHWHKA